MNKMGFTVAAVALLAASPAMAQGRGRGNGGVPPGQRPPAGMCRVWIDGVPPGRQPAPTDCGTAAATRPVNARIIYGDNTMPNRRVYTSNGNVVIMNGQKCIQRADVYGQVRTTCGTENDGDRDDAISSRIDRRQDRMDRAELNGAQGKKHKHKHKGHGDRDHDGDDRN